MYQYGHYGAALLAYAPIGAVVALADFEAVAIVGGLVCVSLSTLPDVDHRLPFVAHRGPTHTLVFAALVGAALAAAAAVLVEAASPLVDVAFVGFAFLIGTLSIGSHLLADALTPMGIRPFWPVSRRRYTLNVTPAKSPVANYVLFLAGVAATAAAAGVVLTAG